MLSPRLSHSLGWPYSKRSPGPGARLQEPSLLFFLLLPGQREKGVLGKHGSIDPGCSETEVYARGAGQPAAANPLHLVVWGVVLKTNAAVTGPS